MGGGNSGFSRTKGKAAPNPYDLKPGEYRDFQNAFPFGTSKSGKAAVAVVGGVPTLAVLGLIRRKVRSKAALSPDGSTRAPRLMGEDYVYNSGTKGPKKAIYGPPRKPSAPTRPFIEADAPIKSVTASKISDKTRNAVRRVAKDALTFPRQLLTLGQYNPVVPDYTSLPASSKGVPRNPTPTRTRFARSQVLSANAKSEGMTSGQRGGLRRKANNAANAAKPMIQNALRKREQSYARQEFGQQRTEVANKYLKTKANIGEYAANSEVMRSAFATRFPGPGDTPAAKVPDAPKPTTPKKPKAPKAPKTPTPKAPAATTVEIKAPEMTARAFQPGKLEGETRAQTSARHVAEHAADNAAKRAEKKKVEPKNKTKAPTSAKPPSPAAVEKVSTPKPSLTAAERKAAKDAKSAENRRVHAENQAREREARRAAKAAGGKAPSPSKPAGPKAPSGGFVSTFKPQVRTFDPMVGQKQYGLKSKPYNDSPEAHHTLVKEGMAGRTGKDQRPTHLYDANGRMVHDVGPYSDVGKVEATSPMFPGGTHDAPTPLQPHMTGKDAKIVEKGGNFRIWQGPKRSETVVQHRTGRQLNLPFDPKKNKNPVDNKAILDFANKNEKPFLQKTGWEGARAITQKGGRLGQIGRFSIGAAKAGGILALPIAAVSVLAGSDPLEAAGFQVDRAGEGNSWYAKTHPKKFAADVKSAVKAQSVYQGRRAGSQFKGAASWADIARKYTAGKK